MFEFDKTFNSFFIEVLVKFYHKVWSFSHRIVEIIYIASLAQQIYM